LTKGSTQAGTGYEADPLSSEAMDLHFAHLTRKLIDDAGPLAGKTLQSFFVDSWEGGTPNWTPRFREGFQRRRGYDLQPYLPVLAGKVVHSGDVSERFLWDYRRTIADLIADNFYGRAAKLSRAGRTGFKKPRPTAATSTRCKTSDGPMSPAASFGPRSPTRWMPSSPSPPGSMRPLRPRHPPGTSTAGAW